MDAGTDSADEVIHWLLAGDPAIRWQVQRDLLRQPASVWKREQARVGVEGWGAKLLSFQDAHGRWTPRLYGYKWISTTYSMVLLRRMGLPARDPRAVRACRLFLQEGLWEDGGINLSSSQRRSETCITGMTLGLLSWFGLDDPRREQLVDYLLRHQLADGGWNCEWDRGAGHSSFHTTTSVLEGLREYAVGGGPAATQAEAAERRGQGFLLVHRLFRSHTTGQVVDPRLLRLSFPPRWRHDVLRSLDYFRSAGADRDERMADAMEVVTRKRRLDGRWPLQQRYPGRTWFEMEQVGRPSRWNTCGLAGCSTGGSRPSPDDIRMGGSSPVDSGHPVWRRSRRSNRTTASPSRMATRPARTVAWLQFMPLLRGSLVR